MKTNRKVVIAFLAFFVIASSFKVSSNAYESINPNINESDNQVDVLEKRLKNLEPIEPTQMNELPSQLEEEKLYPSQTVSILEVIHNGTQIPCKVIKELPEYKRPVYDKTWHSTYWGGRWSYIPTRMYYALHRLFTTYDIGLSGQLQFQGNVGIDFPIFQSETALDLYMVVFQTTVSKVYTKGNQIIVVGKPKRTGVEVITITTGDIQPSNKEEMLLVQLATDSGYEIDYSLISYVPPDFWLKQKQKQKQKHKHQ
ncbi:hypothetical protein GCM10010912_55540 [Paenibacillus albidus]|uniref:Uncharacterized protein n=1 Tax=Paenibacillus albidus TaxID=2041023 RepID=A0A917FUH5_9BACL|nr:hypothetical protein [Paenibacillus albidus]GGG03695.1 hypothetical protein GCM10010912_55540 [Paenibacillus albidus]